MSIIRQIASKTNPKKHCEIDSYVSFDEELILKEGVAEGVTFDPHAFTGGLEYVARQRPPLSSAS